MVLGRQQFDMSIHQRCIVGLGILNELLPLLITVFPDRWYAPIRSWVVPWTFLSYIWLSPMIFSLLDVRQSACAPTPASLAYLFFVVSNSRFLSTSAIARPTLLRQRLVALLLGLPFQLVSNQFTCLHRQWDPAVEAYTGRVAKAIARGSLPFLPREAVEALQPIACPFILNWFMLVVGIGVPQLILLKMEWAGRNAFSMRAGLGPRKQPIAIASIWGVALVLPVILGAAFAISLIAAKLPIVLGLDVTAPASDLWT